MVDPSLFPVLSNYASLSDDDIVLDVGAGFGFLERHISGKCKAIFAVEKDLRIAKILREQVKNLTNVTVLAGDVFQVEIPSFTKAISLPPYYLSSQLVIWLLDRGFDCAILVVQKEFANRLVASTGSEEYGWLKVITYPYVKVELLDEMPKWLFYPQPDVDSVIMRLTPWAKPIFDVKDVAVFRRLTKWLFTQRNKKLSNAVTAFIRSDRKISKSEAEKITKTIVQKDARVRHLVPKEFGDLANALVT